MGSQCLSGKYLHRCGAYEGLLCGRDGELYLKGREGQGYFVSRIYDSGERGTQWDRLVLDIDKNTAIESFVWLFDEREEGEQLDRKGTVKERYEMISFRAQYRSNYREMLLYGKEKGRGRHARLALGIYPGGWSGNRIFRGYSLSFPKESFTRYLPEIYRENRDLERFLAVQQSIYLELEKEIDTLGEKLDPVNCNKKQAEMLAGWMGWGELVPLLDEETLRQLLGTGLSLISRKGTCAYYTRLTEILTGERAFCVEETENCRATILVSENPGNGKEKRLDWMRRNVPLGMDVRFVVLGRTDRLDGLFFLDVNAALSIYESELVPGGVNIDGLVLL